MEKIVFFLIFLALLVRVPFLNREFALEEAFHARAAKTVADTLYPLMYYGEQQPPTIYLDRPPALIMALAASFKIFGVSELSARAVPLIFFFAALLILFRFAKKLFDNHTAAILALIFLSLHPYMIQNSLMLHFDGALVLFFSSAYLLLALVKITKKKNTWTSHIQLAAIIYFSLWVKYEPTLLMIATVVVFTRIYYKPFLKKLIISSLLATILFSISFFLYNFIMGHPQGFWLPLERITQLSKGSYLGKITPDQSLSMWAGSYYIAIRFLSWLSIPTILLSIYAAIRFLQEKTLRKDPKIIFLVTWTLVFTTTYIIAGWAGDYPRYFAPAIPPLFLFIAMTIDHDFAKFKKNLRAKSIIATAVTTLVIFIVMLKNNLLFLDHITGWIPLLQIPFFTILSLGITLLLFLAIKHKKHLIFYLLVVIFLNLLQITVQYVHDAKSNYSLTNFYGHGGYKQSGQFLKDKFTNKDVAILTIDPVGYYWQGKYFDYYQMGYHRINDPEIFKDAFLNNKIAAVALPKEYARQYATNIKKTGFDFNKYLANNYKNKRNFGGEKGIEVWY